MRITAGLVTYSRKSFVYTRIYLYLSIYIYKRSCGGRVVTATWKRTVAWNHKSHNQDGIEYVRDIAKTVKSPRYVLEIKETGIMPASPHSDIF